MSDLVDEFVPVMGIRLRKDGEHTVVDAEIGGAWIEVIREHAEEVPLPPFSHICEPAGVEAALLRAREGK